MTASPWKLKLTSWLVSFQSLSDVWGSLPDNYSAH